MDFGTFVLVARVPGWQLAFERQLVFGRQLVRVSGRQLVRVGKLAHVVVEQQVGVQMVPVAEPNHHTFCMFFDIVLGSIYYYIGEPSSHNGKIYLRNLIHKSLVDWLVASPVQLALAASVVRPSLVPHIYCRRKNCSMRFQRMPQFLCLLQVLAIMLYVASLFTVFV